MSEENIVIGFGRKVHWLNDRVIFEVSINPELRTTVSLTGEQFVSVFQNVIRKDDRLDLTMLEDMWFTFKQEDTGLSLISVVPGQVNIKNVLLDARFNVQIGPAEEVSSEEVSE